MSSGQYRDELQLLVPTQTDDGEGGQVVSWPDDGPQIWARVRPLSAREQAVAGAVQTLATHRVETYFDSRIVNEARFARIAPSGRQLQIVGIRDNDGTQRWLEIDCSEVL